MPQTPQDHITRERAIPGSVPRSDDTQPDVDVCVAAGGGRGAAALIVYP